MTRWRFQLNVGNTFVWKDIADFVRVRTHIVDGYPIGASRDPDAITLHPVINDVIIKVDIKWSIS
jgi:hypothetical protein